MSQYLDDGTGLQHGGGTSHSTRTSSACFIRLQRVSCYWSAVRCAHTIDGVFPSLLRGLRCSFLVAGCCANRKLDRDSLACRSALFRLDRRCRCGLSLRSSIVVVVFSCDIVCLTCECCTAVQSRRMRDMRGRTFLPMTSSLTRAQPHIRGLALLALRGHAGRRESSGDVCVFAINSRLELTSLTRRSASPPYHSVWGSFLDELKCMKDYY